MKKIIVILLCLNIIFTPCYACKIEDDFVNASLDKNLKIRKQNYTPIVDSFAQANQNKNQSLKVIKFDEILPEEPSQKFVRKPVIIDNNYKEIKVKIKNFYTTKNKMQEGETLEFITLNDIKIKNKFYPKNSIVKARIETISQNKSYGVPADVVIGNFMLDNHILSGEISKVGANRSLWLYPTVCITSCFFGLGLLLIPIRGGHAKVIPAETYTLYSIE